MNKDVQVFVDLDGVLADFDRGYNEKICPYRGKDDDCDWSKIKDTTDFFYHLEPMPDMEILWSHLVQYNPIIITGIPKNPLGILATSNKRAWVDKHLGKDVKVIACRSSDKRLYAKPKDVLIDDWERYKHLWVEMGGHWITHINAENSIKLLEEYLCGNI